MSQRSGHSGASINAGGKKSRGKEAAKESAAPDFEKEASTVIALEKQYSTAEPRDVVAARAQNVVEATENM